ncbi:MAG: dephospho-CoA kinase [Candidatus Aminicenantia bacterium]
MKILKVALTGGIATGKSVISEYLKKKGCYICYSDLLAHELIEPGKYAYYRILEHFGESILLSDKRIDRKKLGEIVFSNEKERKFLNELIHPLVFDEKKRIIEELEKSKKFKIFISEAALTIEARFHLFYHKIIVAHCLEEIRIKRLMERDGISEELAKRKILSQMRNEEKLRFAHYIVDTSDRIEDTIKRTRRVYRALLKDWKELNRI